MTRFFLFLLTLPTRREKNVAKQPRRDVIDYNDIKSNRQIVICSAISNARISIVGATIIYRPRICTPGYLHILIDVIYSCSGSNSSRFIYMDALSARYYNNNYYLPRN